MKFLFVISRPNETGNGKWNYEPDVVWKLVNKLQRFFGRSPGSMFGGVVKQTASEENFVAKLNRSPEKRFPWAGWTTAKFWRGNHSDFLSFHFSRGKFWWTKFLCEDENYQSLPWLQTHLHPLDVDVHWACGSHNSGMLLQLRSMVQTKPSPVYPSLQAHS